MFYYIYVSESDLKKALQIFFLSKKEISCWAFLSYSCQNWGCGLFNLCSFTWSLLIFEYCKVFFFCPICGGAILKSQNFFWIFAKGDETFARSALKKRKVEKKGEDDDGLNVWSGVGVSQRISIRILRLKFYSKNWG